MRRLRAACWRAAELLTRGRRDRDLSDELDAHLQLHVDDGVRAGLSAGEARRRALVALGGLAQTKEQYRDRRGLPWLDVAVQDIRYGIRGLRRNPGFAVVAVLTLALGIGANTAIFGVVNAVLLRPLPFPQASRLVQLFTTDSQHRSDRDVVTYPDFEDWQRQTAVFDAMGAYVARTMLFNDANGAELVRGIHASPGLLAVYGIQPALGRGFAADEDEPGRAHVAIVSDAFRKRHFAWDRSPIGASIRLGDQPYTVVGVLAPGVHVSLAAPEDLLVPLVADPNRGHGFLSVVGRLRDGAPIDRARAELGIVARRLAAAYPKTNGGSGVNVVRLVDAVAGPMRPGLLILFAVVALVLLIACTNVANLLLSRAAARTRELAVRTALGAGRARLIRQLLTESVLLGLLGGAIGLAVATAIQRFLVWLLAGNFRVPRLETTAIDGQVLAFTMAIAVGTSLLFGVVPALSSSSDAVDGLREAGRSLAGHARARRVRGALAVGELAMALVLLTGAGALLKTLWTLRATPPGFRPEGVLTVEYWLPQPRFALLTARRRFFESVLARVRATPGVRSAGLVADLPLGGGSDGLSFHIVGRPDPAPNMPFEARFNIASAGYFETMGVPIRAGRTFVRADSADAPGVIVINDAAARRFWPDTDPIGHQIALPQSDSAPDEHEADRPAEAPADGTLLTVVGVVADAYQGSMAVAPQPEFFLHTDQADLPWPWLVLVVKAYGDPTMLAASIKNVSKEVDAMVPLQRMATMDDVLTASMAQPRVYTMLVGLFASVALALAAIGLYGVIAYGVAQRTHELGIRLALGAARGEILRLVLGQGLVLSLIGIAIGLAGGVGIQRVLAGLVPGVEAFDPLTLAAMAAVLVSVSLAASYAPARRAARVDPMTALRVD